MSTDKNGTGITILVVDDNPDNLRVVSSFLTSNGYHAELSINTVEAYRILNQTRIDLILLDIMMPKENGYDFCRRIKEEDIYKDVPVIFLTARSDIDDMVEGFNAGGVDYITKPFRREVLLARVRSHLDLANARKSIVEQAEFIMQINRIRDRMYSIISHDVKAPFANISMMISMLAEGYLDPDSDEFRNIIQKLNYSTKETYALLENLLDWTRAQTGKLKCNPEKINLSETIENSVSFISYNAENKNIKILSEVDNGIDLNVDPNMIKSIIRNLLSNAVKFSHSGDIVSIRVIEHDNQIDVSVSDNGIGMDTGKLSDILNDGVCMTTYGTSNEKGSGLGLQLVKDFTELNGGKLTVSSEPSKGTTFKLTFPLS